MVDCLIVGPHFACWYEDIFPLIRDGKLYLGYIKFQGDRSMYFKKDDIEKYRISSIWFQNLYDHPVDELKMTKRYEDGYDVFDNYPAIRVKSYKDIPGAFYGLMGLPVMGFLTRWNKDQFDVIETISPRIDGKELFENIIIRRKKDG